MRNNPQVINYLTDLIFQIVSNVEIVGFIIVSLSFL